MNATGAVMRGDAGLQELNVIHDLDEKVLMKVQQDELFEHIFLRELLFYEYSMRRSYSKIRLNDLPEKIQVEANH